MIRSKLWTAIDSDIRGKVPTLATVIKDHAKLDVPVEVLDNYLKEDEKTQLY